MDAKYYGLVEVSFTALVVFGIGLWQLWSLRRDEKRPDKRKNSPVDKHITP